jgi:hypothetical protein
MKTIISILLASFMVSQVLVAQDSIPSANAEIIKYVSTVIGKKVDRGECWDIANQALTRINAKWDKKFVYGRLLNPKTEVIFPGDIIQFKNVMFEYTLPNGKSQETMKQHTAIVYRVIAPGEFELAHQNTGFSGRKMGLSTMNLKNLKKGKIFIYRPVVE